MLSDLDSDCEINVYKFMYVFTLWMTHNFNEGRTQFICELIDQLFSHSSICLLFPSFIFNSLICLLT